MKNVFQIYRDIQSSTQFTNDSWNIISMQFINKELLCFFLACYSSSSSHLNTGVRQGLLYGPFLLSLCTQYLVNSFSTLALNVICSQLLESSSWNFRLQYLTTYSVYPIGCLIWISHLTVQITYFSPNFTDKSIPFTVNLISVNQNSVHLVAWIKKIWAFLTSLVFFTSHI